MEYFFTQEHDCILYSNIQNILIACKTTDKSIYEFNEEIFNDFDYFILAGDRGESVGFIAVSNIGESTIEIIGAVIPSSRRKGIFKYMLEDIRNRIKIDNIVFSGKESYNGFSQCANALGYSDELSEHLMVFEPSIFTPSAADTLEAEFDEDESTYYYYIDDTFIGSVSIYDTASVINIYDVFVETEFRNRGMGFEIISDVLWDLINSRKRIQLQVSGTNTAALKLYEKCGFIQTDTVIMYGKSKG